MRFILSTLFCVIPSLALAADAPPATAPTATRYATREMRITSELGLEEQQEINASAAAETARQFGLAPEQWKQSFQTNFLVSQSESRWTVILTLPPAAKPVAREFLDQFVTRVQESVTKADHEARTRELERIKPQLEAAEKRLAEATDKARRLREELRHVADRADISAAGIQSAVASLEEERQRLELDVLGKNARREALEEQIAVQSEQAAKKVEEDPVMAELRKVVELRENQSTRLEESHTAGMAPRSELDDAMARLAELRAKLLERRQQAAIEAGGEVLATFNRELLTLSVDLREMNARLEFVNKRLDRLRQAIELVDPLEGVEREGSNARALAEGARMRGREIEDRQPPKIEILSSDNRPEPPKQPPQAPEIMY